MKKFLYTLFSMACISACLASDTQTPSKEGELDSKWKLVWSDEFDYTGLPDTNKWSYEVGYIRNNELQYYTESRLKNARVEEGKLIIETHKEQYKDFDYTSASVISRGKGAWLYGRIEIRAKLPGGKGIWPALWMLPENKKYDWPKGGEIDIMELVGFDPLRVHSTVHTYDTLVRKKTAGQSNSITLNTPQSDFHLYALEWYPDRLDFFVDDKKIHSYSKKEDTIEFWPFCDQFYLLRTIAWGGTRGGSKGIDPECLPQRMEIDYVRVYQEKTAEQPK